MLKKIYDPAVGGPRMTIVCFISGSGTNYREIVKRGPEHNYLVFTNRPGCGGLEFARQFGHPVVELSHVPYLREIRKQLGAGKVPRNCPEREAFEKEAVRLIEAKLGRQPDLICLAGYDQLNTNWFVDRYKMRVLNVHPGDSSRGYAGLHTIPAKKAILAGEETLRSTLFFINKGMDSGPILVQSRPLNIVETLAGLDRASNRTNLLDKLKAITAFRDAHKLKSYARFLAAAPEGLKVDFEEVGGALQEALKKAGDWQVYPFGVHDLIARGRVETVGRRVLVDGWEMPNYGFRMENGKK
jgi:folate-dependent phosphoribosylglycinamide formyltransferase PurN